MPWKVLPMLRISRTCRIEPVPERDIAGQMTLSGTVRLSFRGMEEGLNVVDMFLR